MCEHLRVDPDDPEARIRELERSLSERASELGTEDSTTDSAPPHPAHQWTGSPYPSYPAIPGMQAPPPGPQPPPWPGTQAPWPGATSPTPESTGSPRRVMLLTIGAVTFLAALGTAASLMLMRPDSTHVPAVTTPSSTAVATPRTPPRTTRIPMPAKPVLVSGIREQRTIACTDSPVLITGIENTVTLTGHCTKVTVSGVQNTVTVDEAGSIDVSGFDNHITYHTGTPEVANTGSDSTVTQG